MTVTIPEWVLWMLEGLGVLVILILAAIGCIFLYMFKDWDGRIFR